MGDAWEDLFRMVKARGLHEPPPVLDRPPFVMCWPDDGIGVVAGGVDHRPLERQGWEVVVLQRRELEGLGELGRKLDRLARAKALRTSRRAARCTTSELEQSVLAALYEAGVGGPGAEHLEPDRNFRVVDADGVTLGTCDFAWPRERVALEVDGWHWHAGKDFDAMVAAAASGPDAERDLRRQLQEKGAKDAAKRRELGLQGFRVVVVHDAEIGAGEGARIAADLARMLVALSDEGPQVRREAV